MEEELEKILLEIISHHPKTKDDFNDARRRICGKMKTVQPSNMKLFKAYQNLLKKKSVKADKNLELLLRKADIRSMSGVAIITSLIKPYTCPGQCIYCPTEVKMPKSYIATEPAAARALALAFSPYRQMQMRLEMLEKTGHPTDKIEYILKGGTWNAYPLRYQYWFILESFKACSTGFLHLPTMPSTISSNLLLLNFNCKCFGPFAPAEINGRLISVSIVVDNSILAFSAASLTLCIAVASSFISIPVSYSNSFII